jgi:hypothetical protein
MFKVSRGVRLIGGAKLVVLGLLLLAGGSLALAQVSASVSGRTTDASGANIPQTTVTVLNQETGVARSATTDDSGNYRVLSLPVGRYEIKAEKPGFKTAIQTGINLTVGQEAELNLTLEVGELQQQITVSGEPPLVNTSTTTTAGLVGEKEVKELPLNGRSFDNLISLNSGVSNVTSQKGGGAGAQSGNLFSISGRRYFENLFLLNGVEYPGPSQIHSIPGGVSGQLLGIDAVREFNVVSDTYGAEYGKRPGGQISIVTQSGSNRLHGSLFEFLRNDKLDAKNYFDQARPPFTRNQFGGALGGPIRKEKTFIFGNYEGFRQHLGLSLLAVVPDANARLGLLPNSAGVPTPVAGLDPRILPYVNAYWPAPNSTNLGGGVALAFSNPIQSIREDFGTVRVDHSFSDKDQLAVNYMVDDGLNIAPLQDYNFSTTTNLRSQVLSLQETHIFSANMINNLTLGYSRAAFGFSNTPLIDFPADLYFVPGLLGRISVGGTTSSGAASITLGGGSLTPLVQSYRNVFTYEDSVQVVKGKHQFSAGVWIGPLQSNEHSHKSGGGVAVFTTLQTLLQDTVSSYQVTTSYTPRYYRQLEGAWYVQDVMQLTPNLTFRIGVRHEFTNGWNEANNQNTNYRYDSSGVLITTPFTGHSVYTENNSKWLFGPRAGIAWDPFGRGKTSIRAGIGTYYDLEDELGNNLNVLAPYNAVSTFTNVPLLSLVPYNPAVPAPPSCGPGVPSPCSIFAPGGVQDNIKTPTIEEWNLSVEQAITPNTSLTLSYVGSHGFHEWGSANANSLHTQICASVTCTSGGVGTARGTVPQGAEYIPVGTRPNQYLSSGQMYFSNVNSSYNSLVIQVVQRTAAGLEFKGSYTYSKDLDNQTSWANGDDSNNAAGFMDPYNPKRDWGPSAQNQTNKFILSGSYELPFGQGKHWLTSAKGLTNKLVGGWQANTIINVRSGLPFTVLDGSNRSGNGDSNNPDRPNANPTFTGPIITGNPNQWFNPNAFLLPVAGTYGNVSRDSLVGPDLREVDLSLFKTTGITERFRLQFRTEGFNLFNRANFYVPGLNVFTGTTINPAAGLISSTTTTSRQIQFGLKLIF